MTSGFCAECGPTVSPVTTMAIIQVESAGNPYAIGDNTAKNSHNPRSKSEAIATASRLLAEGHNIDMGLMQVNGLHLKAGITIADLFDPCGNIRAGTRILADFYRRYDTEIDKNHVLFKALSAYNTGSAWRGPDYINKILAAVKAPYRVSLSPDLKTKLRSVGGLPGKPTAVKWKTPTPENSPLFFDAEASD